MDDGSNNKRIDESFKSKEGGSDPKKLTLKGLQLKLKSLDVKDDNGHAVSDAPPPDRSLPAFNGQMKAGSDTEEGEIIIGSPDADHAESKQESGDGLPPSTHEEDVADHEAVSHNLGKRKAMDDTTCRLCGRNFPSMKSLYGHMRKHARNWKGVSPPPENRTQVPIPATDFDNSNTLLPPLSWSVNAKRCRRVKAADNHEYEEVSEDPVINAANTLMLLANGGFSLHSTPVRQQQRTNPVQHDSRAMNDEDDLKIAALLDSVKTQMDVDKTEGLNQNNRTVDTSVDKTEGTNRNINRLVIDCKPEEKIYDLETATDAPADRRQYSCSTCNKSFSTPQALGGHTASHNKGKSIAGVEEAKLAQGEGFFIGQGGGLPMKVSEHRCKTCGLAFPTGQALGGHMRKHWLGPENVVAPSSQNRPENVVAPSSENRPENVVAPSAENGPENFVAPPRENRCHRDFDLNEPAQPEYSAE